MMTERDEMKKKLRQKILRVRNGEKEQIHDSIWKKHQMV